VDAVAQQRHERVDGAARIEFKVGHDGRTVLGDLYQRAPCRVLFPSVESGEPTQAVLLTTSGGLTGGDRTDVQIGVRPGAQATVTTQAAEKLYRALPQDPETAIRVGMRVDAGGWGEWLAQETIVFEGARLRREFRAEVAPTARLLATETLVLGRTAMGERFETGLIHDTWQIRRAGRLIWADALHLDGDIAAVLAAPFGFGTAVACSNVVYVAEDAAARLAGVRELLGKCRVQAAATAFDGLLLTRLLSDDAAALRAAVIALVGEIRELAAALPARLPRVWYC
jgi:urease accessory protein